MTKISAPAKALRAFTLAAAVGFSVACIVSPAQAESARAEAPAFLSDRLSVEVIGQGADVILIPGFASSREVWRPLARRLSASHRVHLVQLAGFAGEPWAHGDGAFIQPVVDELARYAATLDRPAVIGHSMGGLSGLLLAQQHPEAISRVMSVDSLPFFSAMFGPQVTPQTAKPFADQAAASILSADEAAFRIQQERTAVGMMRDEAGRAAMVDWSMASNRQAMASAIREVMTTDARPGLAAMTTPVWAVYASDADGGAPAAMADAVWNREYAALPGVTLKRVDGARHFIMVDQPDRLDALVDAFLKRED
ncbi:alpha/beta fold hydrolase [Brevundimonas diminuta]|jgi:pimeloyl-ACP methyl ester carboxylesterase|uniref:Pimelyl-[acyl-carrier protein] methyl ester esterase n=1 Tax=Brevundimonas diminuta TaxID=293 RepID=A0A2X1CGD6_BREDI|nr:alpha/beta hydrolase [Brevundimonas diminuta]SPU45696.1 Pimelyl-[acyl-carrier protein] methyl ester esterase [Brevundimonas diminuta]